MFEPHPGKLTSKLCEDGERVAGEEWEIELWAWWGCCVVALSHPQLLSQAFWVVGGPFFLAQAWPLQHNLGDCGITVLIFMWLEVVLFIFPVSD